jgi:DNA mismatch repair protein MutL
MAHIHRLDSHTINQIAAGEVVDRPASIVKELVENAIDAGSTAVTVEIKNGGIDLIRITDNGIGMEREDAILSMERHATSKIDAAEDLWHIETLGFRGEALASIAAVSHMEMITKTREGDAGTRVLNHGGEIIHESPAGCPDGTTIIVRNLFFNTPARKKFLKSGKAETIQVSEVLTGMMLAHPEISFRYVNQGKTVYHTPGNGSLLSAICAVYGNAVRHSLIPLSGKGDGLSIEGFIGKPEIARNNRRHQVFIVNGRCVRSKLLTEAVEGAFSPYRMVNRYPFCVLHVCIDPGMVDVNVHPQKTELKFRHPEQVGARVYQWIRDILGRGAMIPRPYNAEAEDKAPAGGVNISVKPSIQDKEYDASASEQVYLFERRAAYGESKEPPKDIREETAAAQEEPAPRIYEIRRVPEIQETQAAMEPDPEIAWDAAYKIAGTLFDTYIVVEQEDTVYLIDQHAAHERLLYEILRHRQAEGQTVVQEMLVPIVVELTHPEYLLMEEKIDSFQALGFEVEPFGQLSVVVRGTPAGLELKDAEAFLHDVLSNFTNGDTKTGIHDMIIKKACRYAVKAGDALGEAEIRHLLREMGESTAPLTCPHGRPILIKWTRRDLERMFGRA